MTELFDKNLLMAIAQQTIVPFVGAGVSLGVNKSQSQQKFLTWKQLLQVLVKELQGIDEKGANRVQSTIDDEDLLDAANIALKKLGKAAFADAVVRAVSVLRPDCDLTLPQAIWGLNPRLIVTTNYDRVLQWGGEDRDPKVVLNNSHSELQALFDEAGRPKIWHLHGHMDNADSMILAPDQYRPLYAAINDSSSELRNAALTLQQIFTRQPVLFIGFSMTDEYVLDAIEQGLQAFKGYAPSRWALLKQGDQRVKELWEKYQVRVIEYEDHGQPLIDLLQKLAAATAQGEIRVEAEKLKSLPAIPPHCLDFARQECANVLPLGIQPSADLSISLQNVYVPALVENARPEPDGQSDGQQKSSHIERPTWQLLMERLESGSLFVAGNAGYGKSTFAKWLRLQVLQPQSQQFQVAAPDEFREVLPESLQGRLPVLIAFRDLVDDLHAQPRQGAMPVADLLALLQRWASLFAGKTGITPELLQAWLQAGRALLILDGIDELPTAAHGPNGTWNPRNVVLASLSLAIREWHQSGNRLLLTSRPYGLEDNQLQELVNAGVTSCSLQPLLDALQTLLVQRWFSVLPEYQQGPLAEAEKMLRAVRAIPRVKELIVSPLQLTAICVVYGQGGELPKDIHDLYNRMVRCSLSSRYSNDTVRVEQNRSRLSRIAWGMHTGDPYESGRRNPLAKATLVEIDGILAVHMEKNPQQDEGQLETITVRNELLQRSGLLVPESTEKAAFQHLSYQEFLAAEWFSKTTTDDALKELYQTRGVVANWRETLRFLTGRRAEERDQSVMTAFVGELLQHVEQLAPSKVPELAVVCCDSVHLLLDRGYQLPAELLAIIRRLFEQSLQQGGSLGARDQLGLLVGRLGDDRPGLDLKSEEAWVTVPADTYPMGAEKGRLFELRHPVQISRYPVTNAEFRKFVAAGGYQEQRYWKSGWEERCGQEWTAPWSFSARGFDGNTQPVVAISWYEACAFCEWLSENDPTYRYALPEEDLWEAAARGPRGYKYSWGDKWQDEWCNSRSSRLGRTSVVGAFPMDVSPCGALDMTGNVLEWTATGGDEGRVLRGGCWCLDSDFCSAWCRVLNAPPPRYQSRSLGFRLARTFQPDP